MTTILPELLAEYDTEHAHHELQRHLGRGLQTQTKWPDGSVSTVGTDSSGAREFIHAAEVMGGVVHGGRVVERD
jgi:hypothetical protein